MRDERASAGVVARANVGERTSSKHCRGNNPQLLPHAVPILEFDDDVNQRLVVTRIAFRKWEKRRFGDIDSFDELESHPLISGMIPICAAPRQRVPERRIHALGPAGITHVDRSNKRLADRIEKDTLDRAIAFCVNPDRAVAQARAHG